MFDVLGVIPQSGWAVDPFGHSATMPYLLKRANLTSMLIQRVHYSIKKHFSATRSLEFMWRQGWGENRSLLLQNQSKFHSKIYTLCHVMLLFGPLLKNIRKYLNV